MMQEPAPKPDYYSNTKMLGSVLYTDYVLAFELAAVILLVAIIAAIALTMRKRSETKYQNPSQQIACARQIACGWSRWRRKKNESVVSHYLVLAALFSISIAGIIINRKNIIILLMSIELMLLSVNFNFIAFSHYLNDMAGQVFVFFILTVAAAEAAIGLAILVVLFRNKHRSMSKISTR